jgi:hypothetical protein
MADDDFEPPVDAAPLTETLATYVDPDLRNALRGAMGCLSAPLGLPPDARRECVDVAFTVLDAMRQRCVQARLRVWAREGSPVGPWRRLPDEAWRYIEIRPKDILLIAVPGGPPISYFSAVVAPEKQEEANAFRQLSDEAMGAGRRRRNAQDDALLKNKIRAVLASAKQLWPDKRKRPKTTPMVNELIRRGKAQGYSSEALRKILDGTYEPAKRLGINLDW